MGESCHFHSASVHPGVSMSISELSGKSDEMLGGGGGNGTP